MFSGKHQFVSNACICCRFPCSSFVCGESALQTFRSNLVHSCYSVKLCLGINACWFIGKSWSRLFPQNRKTAEIWACRHKLISFSLSLKKGKLTYYPIGKVYLVCCTSWLTYTLRLDHLLVNVFLRKSYNLATFQCIQPVFNNHLNLNQLRNGAIKYYTLFLISYSWFINATKLFPFTLFICFII